MKYSYYADLVLAPMVITGLLEYHVLTYGMRWSMVLYAFAGLVFWSFAEYAVHRALHVFKVRDHFQHHVFPKDQAGPSILTTLAIMADLYAASFLVGGASMSTSFYPGILIGYTIYLYAHNAVHYTKAAPNSGIRLRHEKHHRGVDNTYGVITGLWDFIFGAFL